MRASQADKGLRTISGTQMSYNQKVPVFSGTFLSYRPGIVVHLTPTASAASFGHRKMLAFFCDTHLARFFDIDIAFDAPMCIDFYLNLG